MRGRVTEFDERRGLGTVTASDGTRYPFHCTQITGESRAVAAGAAVEFDVAPGRRGLWEATRIRPG